MKINIQLIFFSGCLAICSCRSFGRGKDANVKPVVFIPGTAGCQLEARWNKPSVIKDKCEKVSDWTRIWLDVWYLFPGRVECWADNFRMVYNVSTKTSSNSPGVEVRVPGWGKMHTIEYLDPSWTAWLLGDVGAYAAPLVKEMKKWGYQTGLNLVGAPYDFRLAPHSHAKYFEDLKDLIEKVYRKNQNKKVALMSHSMGGLFGLYFLNNVPESWKLKYIDSFIPISSPWQGSVLTQLVYASGYNWNNVILDPLIVRHEQRTTESNAYMLPHPGAWGPNEVIVQTPQKNYTVMDYDQFFDDIGFSVGKYMLANVKDSTYDMHHPLVDVYCIYGFGIETPEVLKYGVRDFPNKQPRWITGPGDGTVNLRSLQYCKQWVNQHGNPGSVNIKTFPGVPHKDIIRNQNVFDYLKKILVEI